MMSYVCIECGESTSSLFKQYSTLVLKLSICGRCNNAVDKYIEYDLAVIMMDLVLQKLAAYRHILHNRSFSNFWRLGIICIICDTYTRWSKFHVSEGYPELKWDFYLQGICAFIEFAFKFVTLFILTSFQKIMLISKRFSWIELLNALLLAEFGRLFAIPALVWGQSHSQVYLFLTTLFIFISHVQAYRAIADAPRYASFTLICLSFTAKHYLSECLASYIGQ